MTTEVLSLKQVTIGFNDGPDVLRGVDLSVHEGEFVSVLGPSGCGKSTILNAVAGLQPIRGGTVTFCEKEVRGVNTRVGYMTQGDTLLPWRTVFDNVAMPLRLRKTDRATIRNRTVEMLRMLDLEAAARKFPAQLSGGMKRRALLARSMIYEPQMLLMDEPFAALDSQLRTQMHAELLRTVNRLGQTVTFITHDIDEAVLLSDRVVVVGDAPGRVIGDVAIPFGKERNVETIRFEEDFRHLEREIHGLLDEARRLTHSATQKEALR